MLRFFIMLGITAVYLWFLSHPVQLGESRLPPPGKFFSSSEGFWHNAETKLDSLTVIQVPGLMEKVTVVLDDRRVPRIYASSDRDLYFAQGFITAADRLWQLDIAARSASGRLSEILGPKLIEYDKMQRNLGILYAAENAIERWKQYPETWELVEAYADGISEYVRCLKPRNYPLEFKLMNYDPEPYSPLMCALFVKSMASTLSTQEYDLEFSNLLSILGDSAFNVLYPEFNPHQDPIIPPGTRWDFEPLKVNSGESREAFMSPSSLYESKKETTSDRDIELGSNNWALSGQRTATGNPILCNDPHLKLSLPSIFYEAELHSPNQDCHGVSLPGMPGIILGFNENIAWGMTNAGYDVLDWYHIEWIDREKGLYNAGGKQMQIKPRIEEFLLPDGQKVYDTIEYTIWGPVMKSGSQRGMARRWIAHDGAPRNEATTFLSINKAANLDEFLGALDNFHAPAHNFVYADTEGNIALRIGGSIPLREQGSGRFVTDGSVTPRTWSAIIPPSHNPVVVNPPRGFVSSANQKSTDDTYPYYYVGGHYFEDYRGRTLNNELAKMTKARPDDQKRLQLSNYSLKAREILPHLLAAVADTSLGEAASAIYNQLENWDYNYDSESPLPVCFEIWYSEFYFMTWDEIAVVADTVAVTFPESWRTIELAIESPDSPVFDLDSTLQTETFRDIAYLSLLRAAEAISTVPDSQLVWGSYRPTTIQHLADIPGMSTTVENAGGHGDALNAVGSRNGPSWRMIVDLSQPVSAQVVYPGGQSGNPGSAFYDNGIKDWEAGNYNRVELISKPEDVAGGIVIEMKPKNR